MEINSCTIPSFSVIGKEGSTNDGPNFVQALWEDANSHFHEVVDLALKDEKGNILGIWGLMSDISRSFKPWQENFTKGLYLAGVQVDHDTTAPEGWVKWTTPSYEYLYVKVEGDYKESFDTVLAYMDNNEYKLAGAVFDYNCPEENGQLYLFFPVKVL
ncbi:GyrI-like domain-containing protein [Anaeromicropila herbilytica]|uniref:AraC family transcriptional regulator n=1 Tax=Anaeromicropila herbilytica TaxID=2785025 RepID=A0A7R7EJK0_9FIRM|nr:GyrI-like domain-containing protein [Anaeromicropila herbilytica]BCN29953.1 AraC family transcriptional regulator [Anaeromicropila herbilytica]